MLLARFGDFLQTLGGIWVASPLMRSRMCDTLPRHNGKDGGDALVAVGEWQGYRCTSKMIGCIAHYHEACPLALEAMNEGQGIGMGGAIVATHEYGEALLDDGHRAVEHVGRRVRLYG